MRKKSKKNLREARNDNIPYDVTYADLTSSQKIELHEIMEKACKTLAYRMTKKTLGELDPSECTDDLQHHLYVLMNRLESEKPNAGKTYNVLGYLRTGLNNEYRRLLNEHFDGKALKTQIEAKLAGDAVSDTDVRCEEELANRAEEVAKARDRASHTIETITQAANELGIEIEADDWVVTALNVIRVGVHGNALKGELFEKMDAIREGLEASGYKTRSSTEIVEPQGWGIEDFVRKLILEDPDITTAEVKRKLEEQGAPFNPDSIVVMVSRCRAGKTKVPARPHITTEVKSLWDAGVRDLRDIQDKLTSRGLMFKPSLVRMYVSNLRRTGKCVIK